MVRVQAWLPLVAVLGSPVVSLPAPVTLLFALLAPGTEKFKSIGLDSFSKATLLRYKVRTTQLAQCNEVCSLLTLVYSPRWAPTTAVTRRWVPSSPQEARAPELSLPGPPPAIPQPWETRIYVFSLE